MDRPSLRAARPRADGRRVALLAVVAAALLTVIGTAWTPPLVTPATSGRTFGQGPLEAVTAAATAKAGCGLSSVELAAMMIAPTYSEAGGPVPSPMTLSRYDNVGVSSSNANLFAFGRTSGAYVNAFFSPGIGMWQFDSAGGWPFSAAGAIDSVTAANQAATTIAYRWCNAPADRQADRAARRKYAWGPWYGCSTTNACEDVFASMATGDRLNTAFDPTVTRYGGMQQRRCNVSGVGDGLTCWYVNPALAEGARWWTAGAYDGTSSGVTPLPKPFYVVEAGGREYRIWITADTGYDIGITASKPITANARTSLTWSATASLCDLTANRGSCTGPRVAQSPSGPRTAVPFGSLGTVTGKATRTITASGWAIDPDTNDPIDVHLYVDGAFGAVTKANLNRPDVAKVVPGYGAAHGYSVSIGGIAPGTHQVCAYGINVGPYGDTNPPLGCRSVTVPGDPFGTLLSLTAVPGGLRAQGWAVDPDTGSPIDVHLYLEDGSAVATKASAPRLDVVMAYPWAGPDHGFDVVLPTSGGPHTVCAYGINVGPNGTTNPQLGCQTATVDGTPLGSLEAASPAPGGLVVKGWAFDPDTNDATVSVRVDGGAAVDVATDLARTDLATTYPGHGSTHGFQRTIPAAAGVHQVCATVANQGAFGNVRDLGCRSVKVLSGAPVGSLAAITHTGTTARITGWTFDPDTTDPILVDVYVDGKWAATGTANAARSDIGAKYPAYGSRHGIALNVDITFLPSQICVYAINVGPGAANPLLGCRVV